MAMPTVSRVKALNSVPCAVEMKVELCKQLSHSSLLSQSKQHQRWVIPICTVFVSSHLNVW